MATFSELPYPALSHIIGFLPLLDVINVSKVYQSWKQVASKSIKKVEIDESTVYGGCWQKYYEEQDETTTDKNFEKFAWDLANFTDGIEQFYFKGSNIPLVVFEILLSSQKELKTLTVSLERSGRCAFEEQRTKIGKAITQAIIKHEKSLEKINIGVHEVFLSFKEMSDAFYNKDLCFLNLRSIEFLSTTVGDFQRYTLSTEGGDDNDEKKYIMSELKNAELMFKKIFNGPKIEELNYKPKMPLALYYDYEIFWTPPFIQLLKCYFELGVFLNLRKINIDSLNSKGIDGEFSESNADLLIQNCPHITHIDSDLFLCYIDDYVHQVHDEKPFVKIIKHYGPQLIHLHCYTDTNIANCIVENCPNVKTLTITDYFGDGLSDSALISLSGLQKLKNLTVYFHGCGSDGLTTLLENCMSRLTKLQINFDVRGNESNLVFNKELFGIVQENGKNLKTFRFYADISSFDSYVVATEAFIRMLRSCSFLRCLMISFDRRKSLSESEKAIWMEHIENVSQILISDYTDLHQLGLYILCFLPEEKRQQLITSIPYCNMLFNNYAGECSKF